MPLSAIGHGFARHDAIDYKLTMSGYKGNADTLLISQLEKSLRWVTY